MDSNSFEDSAELSRERRCATGRSNSRRPCRRGRLASLLLTSVCRHFAHVFLRPWSVRGMAWSSRGRSARFPRWPRECAWRRRGDEVGRARQRVRKHLARMGMRSAQAIAPGSMTARTEFWVPMAARRVRRGRRWRSWCRRRAILGVVRAFSVIAIVGAFESLPWAWATDGVWVSVWVWNRYGLWLGPHFGPWLGFGALELIIWIRLGASCGVGCGSCHSGRV